MTLGLQMWRASLATLPQYPQVTACSATTGVQRWPFDEVTAPQVEQTYFFFAVLFFAEVFFFPVFLAAAFFFVAIGSPPFTN